MWNDIENSATVTLFPREAYKTTSRVRHIMCICRPSDTESNDYKYLCVITPSNISIENSFGWYWKRVNLSDFTENIVTGAML